jgi:hypothetical protein
MFVAPSGKTHYSGAESLPASGFIHHFATGEARFWAVVHTIPPNVAADGTILAARSIVGGGEPMIWRDFEAAAPHLAQRGRERFERTRVALIATIRRDGSPRISPVEPYLALGHLLLGVMSRSAKAGDLARDARCAIHSSVSDVKGSEGEFRLHGRAIAVDDEIRDGTDDAWWKAFPAGACLVRSMDIESAEFVDWDLASGEMIVTRWSPSRGLSEDRHPYP